MRLLLSAIWLIGAGAVGAEQTSLSGREIAQRVQDRDTGEDESTASEMRLINAQGEVRTREFLTYRKNFPGGKKTLMKFRHPADIKDTGNLNEETKGADDIQYLYLPATQKLRRVSSKGQSWVGSDFIYEDLQELELDDYTYDTLPSEPVDGMGCHVYVMVPISPDRSTYGKQTWWVRTSDYVPLKIAYYGREGKLLKVVRMTDLRETHGVVHAWHTVMEHVQDRHRTELRRQWLVVNSGIPDALLTTRQLQKTIESYNHPPDLWGIWR